MAQAGPDPLQQQSAALAQQAVQDNSKREQTGGKKKSLFANLAPYIGGIEFAVLEPILGNLQGVNPSQISIPGIINHFRVDDTSLIPNGKFARRDVMWFFDAMKQGQTKEDTLFGEKQKQEGEKSEREQLFHKSQETPNREYDEAHRPQQQGNHDNQQQQRHDDSDGSYWRGIQMAENQRRMSMQKNDHNYDQMIQDAHHQKEWFEYAKGQSQIIAQIHQEYDKRKRDRAQGKTI